MACFIVPTTEAIVTTIAAKVIKKKEADHHIDSSEHISLSRKMGWLNNMLWGGSALLAFEHVWHGEVQPFFPFLTAASDPESTAEMLHEMATSGTAMAAVVTLAWAGLCAAVSAIQKRGKTEEAEA
ncbi:MULTISPECIES: hypothetical protein [Ruminococcus]|uniref:Uncharacterized protein n=1 Tax=Ruminococcus albus 8 TaxID=246199 RepID=E9S8S7_RUMAL|nr:MULTISPECIES: hypothetical protein [Ruminococcus]EGC04273.1 hypothetical protein CUS_5572 [Ruminococcus albus 8]MBQ9540898.1 hypothetical protein [Ruminococcus sp.]MBR0530054.1 hypothetical protein [Ruminococcus sp.]MCC3349651.1 hypothetical protein [Ruminococcus albus 8]